MPHHNQAPEAPRFSDVLPVGPLPDSYVLTSSGFPGLQQKGVTHPEAQVITTLESAANGGSANIAGAGVASLSTSVVEVSAA